MAKRNSKLSEEAVVKSAEKSVSSKRSKGKTLSLIPEKKICTVDDLLFADVEKKSAKDLLPDYNFCSYNSHIVSIKLDEKDIIVNNCSENYLPIPNKELFMPLENKLKDLFGDSLSIKREIKNNSQFYVDYIFDTPENRRFIMQNDLLIPKISIQNSYNGKLNYGITGGLHRLVCENGLAIPNADFDFNLSVSHCGYNIDKIVEATLENINSFINSSKLIVESLEPLYQQKVKDSDIQSLVEEVLNETKVLLSLKKEIISRISEENKTKGIEMNLWSVYNGINYFLQPQHNEWLSCSPDVRKKMDQKVLDYMLQKVA